MATAIELLNQRQDEDWLQGWDDQGKLRPQLTAKQLATAANRAKAWLEQQDWSQLIRPSLTQCADASAESSQSHFLDLSSVENHELPQRELTVGKPIILLAIADPAQFLAWFSALSSLGYPLFLGDPAWGLKHWQQVGEGLDPDLVIIDPGREIPANFHKISWPVDNSIFLWEKLDFPQIITTCGKRIDPNDHRVLKHLSPQQDYPQAVESLWIGIPTGGSSGLLRFAMHSWKTLTASVSGLQQSQLTREDGVINSCCTLPLHHVSGLMQFLRSLLSGGQLKVIPWSLVKDHFCLQKVNSTTRRKDTKPSDFIFSCDQNQFFLSLVPTQLQQLLASSQAQEWIACFNTVLLGGAPAWPTLLDRSRSAGIRLAPTYGMTETASQIITLHPDDFLKGQSSCGKLLPHAQIDWVAAPAQWSQEVAGNSSLQQGIVSQGLFKIRASSLALGYYQITARTTQAQGDYVGKLALWSEPPGADDRFLVTDDLGYCNEEGYFYVIGRASNKIISGGENVFPAAVEAAILATGIVADAVVLGIADPQWGQRVVAVVATQAAMTPADCPSTGSAALAPGALSTTLVGQLEAAIAPTLSPAQRPKQWLVTQALPRNAQGKIQRRQLEDWVMAQKQDS